VAHEGTYSGQSPAFIATLGATRYSFSINVAHAHGGDSVGSRWMFFLSSFFSLSFPGKTHLNFQKKKQLYTLVCNLINFDPPFNYCFIWLLMLLKFEFISILSLGIFSIWFSYRIWVPLLLIALFMCFIFFLFIFFLIFSLLILLHFLIHWRLTWLLISRLIGLVEMRVNWPGHPH